MDQLLQQEASAADEMRDEEEDESADETMECVICSQSSIVSTERPIALVTLAMATSGKNLLFLHF